MKCIKCGKQEVYETGEIHKRLLEELKGYERFGYKYDENVVSKLCNQCLRVEINYGENLKAKKMHDDFRKAHPDFAEHEDRNRAIMNKLIRYNDIVLGGKKGF